MNYWLGIDGGGSKTDFLLVSQDGHVLGTAVLEGINPNYSGRDDVLEVLNAGKRRVLSSAGLDGGTVLCGTIICLAGFTLELSERLNPSGFGEIFVSGDHLPLLELCGDGEHCIVIHSGTGSFVSSRGEGSAIRYWGGYGYLLHDPGSGSDIGRRAVRRAFEELSGVAPKTKFGERIRSFYDFRSFDHLTEIVYGSQSPARTLAACVHDVVDLHEDGDLLASEIITASLRELASLALKVAGEFPPEPCFRCLSGGVLTVPSVAQIMSEELEALGMSGQWTAFSERPIEGVRRMLTKWLQGEHPDVRYRCVSTALT